MTTAQALLDLYHPLVEENQNRLVRTTKLDIIERTPSVKSPLSGIGVPGTLTIFVTRKGSGYLDEVKAAIEEGGERAAELVKNLYSQTLARRGISTEEVRAIITERDRDQLSKRIENLRRQLSVKKEASLEEVARQIIDQPVFGHIQYGSTVLAQYIFVPEGTDKYVLTFPYTGGRLAREGFRLVERYKEDSDVALDALVVRANPFLTAAEKAVLRQVPTPELHVGPESWCDTTAWAVAALAAGAAVAVATAYGTACPEAVTAGAEVANAVNDYGNGGIDPQVFSNHLSEEDIRKLGPMASVREIMQMRQDALLANPKMKYKNLR